MKKRTPEERKKILQKCLEIERKNGDVLAYLASEGFVSPRATWYNFQREDLKRETMKNGRPRETSEQKADRIKRQRIIRIVEAAEAGESIRDVLVGMGFGKAYERGQQYRYLRKYAEEWMPEMFEKMPEKLDAPNQAKPKEKQKEAEVRIVDRVPEVEEITRKSVLMECLQYQRRRLDAYCEDEFRLTPKKGKEKQFEDQQKKCMILQGLIQAYDSEPVRAALHNWQTMIMEAGGPPKELKI